MTRVISVAVVVAGCWLAWTVAASVYRSQHCIQLFGHWIDVSGTTTPAVLIGNQPVKLFCQ